MEKVKNYKNFKYPFMLESQYKIRVPFDEIFKRPEFEELNRFIMNKKRSFVNKGKKDKFSKGDLICQYLNYFIHYYDVDNELLLGYLKIKTMIDVKDINYTEHQFISDLYDLLLTPTMISKIEDMCEYNYEIDLTPKNKNKKLSEENKILQFTNEHGKILMNISFAMKMFIPLINHYMYMYKINSKNVRKFVLNCFDGIFACFEGDENIYLKLYATSTMYIGKSYNKNIAIWENKLEIQGEDTYTEIDKIVHNLVIDIIFKYIYNKSLVSYNTACIKHMLDNLYKAKFDHDYTCITSIKDAEGLSGFDKMEMNNSKFDETVTLMSSINVKQTINQLANKYVIEWDDDEIEYYKKNIKVKKYQRDLIFQLFSKYFGGTNYLYSMNKTQYCKLIIIMKRMLEGLNFKYMQFILSGKVKSIKDKKVLNKKLLNDLKTSSKYEMLYEKEFSSLNKLLFDQKKLIESYLTTILNSSIQLVDYERKDYTGELIDMDEVSVIMLEFLRLVALI